MIIDNGNRVRLIISGVFDGEAGLSRGVVAFRPNRTDKPATSARAGLLDGAPVRLAITCTPDGMCTATSEPLV